MRGANDDQVYRVDAVSVALGVGMAFCTVLSGWAVARVIGWLA